MAIGMKRMGEVYAPTIAGAIVLLASLLEHEGLDDAVGAIVIEDGITDVDGEPMHHAMAPVE
jgi:hypothetical protein